MKAIDLVLRVVNEVEKGKFEIEEFKPHMEYESFIGCILADSEILRPTGLKDINGIEIYEGDIIKCEVKDKSTKCEEAYALDKFGFRCVCEDIKKTVNYKIEFWNSLYNYGYRVRNGKANFMITQGILHTIKAEIVGNIYNDSDLLNQ